MTDGGSVKLLSLVTMTGHSDFAQVGNAGAVKCTAAVCCDDVLDDVQCTVPEPFAPAVVDGGCTRVKNASEVVLQGKDSVLKEVPKGSKRNVCFVVALYRRAAGQKNQFWDDCGVRSSKDGRVLHTTDMLSEKLLSVVKLQDDVYCKKRMHSGKMSWVPLLSQLQADSTVELCTYCTPLKSDSGYRKHVTWLASDPSVAVYEYQGEPPLHNQLHGCARHTDTEYVRTKPQVIANIRQRLSTKRAYPCDVYEQLVLTNKSTTRPRDHKQVCNQAQVLCKESGKMKGVNAGDEVQSVITSLNSYQFVKRIVLTHGLSPIVVAYTDEQILDLKRFCAQGTPASLQSVVSVDRTFNLGSCFVTVCGYRNMSVLHKTTHDHPIFIGPVMLHFDGRAYTYVNYFRCLRDAVGVDVLCAGVNCDVEMVFGSDEKKAMVSALKQVFLEAKHVFCMQHIEENVRRFLTDKVGAPVSNREASLCGW